MERLHTTGEMVALELAKLINKSEFAACVDEKSHESIKEPRRYWASLYAEAVSIVKTASNEKIFTINKIDKGVKSILDERWWRASWSESLQCYVMVRQRGDLFQFHLSEDAITWREATTEDISAIFEANGGSQHG